MTRYRHYKGGTYQVLGTATNTETNELTVIYHNANSPLVLWARPFEMFHGFVPTENGVIKRFERIEEEQNT